MEKVPLIKFELMELYAEIEISALKKLIMAQSRVR